MDKEDPVDYSFKITYSQNGSDNFYSDLSNIPDFST